MSFQSGINNAITVASALYTQTSGFESKKQEKLRQSEIKRLKNDYKQKLNTFLAEEDAINKKYEGTENDTIANEKKNDIINTIRKKRKELLDPIIDKLEELGDTEVIHRYTLKTEEEYDRYYKDVEKKFSMKKIEDDESYLAQIYGLNPSQQAAKSLFREKKNNESNILSNPIIFENGNASNPARNQLSIKVIGRAGGNDENGIGSNLTKHLLSRKVIRRAGDNYENGIASLVKIRRPGDNK